MEQYKRQQLVINCALGVYEISFTIEFSDATTCNFQHCLTKVSFEM